MRTTILTCSALLLCMVTITGCKSSQQTDMKQPEKTATTTASAAKLSPEVMDRIAGEWSVTAIGDSVLDVEKLPVISLQQPENKTNENVNTLLCYANGGCNTINGQFTVADGNAITPSGEFISTMMLCPDPNFDMMMGQAFPQVKSYAISDANGESVLTLYDAKGKKLMSLRKHDIDFINGAWRVTSIDGKQIAPEVGMEMVIDLPEHRVHMNAGCNIVNGTIEPVMDTPAGIKFSNMAATRMTCPNIELEYALLQNLEKVAKCVRSGKKDTALLENSTGKVLITMTRLELNVD